MILELLRGADLESTSRKYRITAATLRDWRDRFLAAGKAGIKSREVEVEDKEKRRLKKGPARGRDPICCAKTSRGREKYALGLVEVESMSQTVSASSHKAYGVARDSDLEPGSLQLLRRAQPGARSAPGALTRSEGASASQRGGVHRGRLSQRSGLDCAPKVFGLPRIACCGCCVKTSCCRRTVSRRR